MGQSVACNGSTCMSVCEEGKVSVGQRRTRCRFKNSVGFFWKKTLAECQGCTPENLTVTDTNVSMACSVNSKNIKTCLMTCPAGMKILGGKKLKLKCKCPRQSDGSRTCGWIGKRSFMSEAAITGLTCTGTATGGTSTGSTGTTGTTGTGTTGTDTTGTTGTGTTDTSGTTGTGTTGTDTTGTTGTGTTGTDTTGTDTTGTTGTGTTDTSGTGT